MRPITNQLPFRPSSSSWRTQSTSTQNWNNFITKRRVERPIVQSNWPISRLDAVLITKLRKQFRRRSRLETGFCWKICILPIIGWTISSWLLPNLKRTFVTVDSDYSFLRSKWITVHTWFSNSLLKWLCSNQKEWSWRCSDSLKISVWIKRGRNRHKLDFTRICTLRSAIYTQHLKVEESLELLVGTSTADLTLQILESLSNRSRAISRRMFSRKSLWF